MKLPAPQKGMSIIELLVVIATISILVFLIGSLPNSISLITRSQRASLARSIATKQIEDKREIKYANLPFGTETMTDNRLRLLPGGSGTVEITECGSICAGGELAKQITVTVTWRESGDTPQVKLKSLISDGGLN